MNSNKINAKYAHIKFQSVATTTSHKVLILGVLLFKNNIYKQKNQINQNTFYFFQALVMNYALSWAWSVWA